MATSIPTSQVKFRARPFWAVAILVSQCQLSTASTMKPACKSIQVNPSNHQPRLNPIGESLPRPKCPEYGLSNPYT